MSTPDRMLIERLRTARVVACLGHETPDADCLGSAGGLALGLRAMGKEARLLMPGGVARKLDFLLGIGDLRRETEAAALAGCDLAAICDTAKEKRVNGPGGYAALQHLPIVNIDHHATNSGYGTQAWIDATRSSASEMVFEILQALDAPIDARLATLIYAGIFSDTQGFSLSNTTPRSLEVAAELARRGARVSEVCERLDRSVSCAEFALLRVIYANTQLSDDGVLAWSSASYAEITGAGCNADTIDDQVEVPRSIEGIRVAVLFTEGEPGVVRMNFRGEGGLSILALAEQFGGGGHHAAAGARQRGELREIVTRVLGAAREFLRTR